MKKNKAKDMKKPVKATKPVKAKAKPAAKPKADKKKATDKHAKKNKPAAKPEKKVKPPKVEKVKAPKPEKIKKEKAPKPEKIKKVKPPKPVKLPKLKKNRHKTKKEPAIELPPPPAHKKKISLEFVIRSSPVILYDFVTAPTNLAQWFADSVDANRGVYTFKWDDGEEKDARVIDQQENEFIKYQWLDKHPGEFFEFRITHTEITGDTVLTITDFSEPIDYENDIDLWESQVHNMVQRMGA